MKIKKEKAETIMGNMVKKNLKLSLKIVSRYFLGIDQTENNLKIGRKKFGSGRLLAGL